MSRVLYLSHVKSWVLIRAGRGAKREPYFRKKGGGFPNARSAKIILWVLCLSLLACPTVYAAKNLTLEEVLASSLAHFPKIQEAKAKREATEASVQAALGSFDPSLDNSSSVRTAGFYDGNQTSTKIVKPFENYNARVSAGYRLSDGSFPIYEDERFTNDGGEFNLEAFISLLRDRDIDDDRLSLWNSRLNVTQAKQEELLAKISTQHAAMKAYYEWLAAGEILRINENLLSIAQERQKGLVSRANQGDIATITVTENKQYIYQREGLLNNAKRLYANAAANLSIYWRDKNGEMLPPDSSPLGLPKTEHDSPLLPSKEISSAYATRPEFSIVEAEITKQKNELSAGENKLLPRADLVVKAAKDSGDGSITRQETENIIGINISIPLQNNTAEGTISKAKANLKALDFERQMLRNKIAQQLQFIENDLTAAARYIDISNNEVGVAKKMQSSEQQIFNNGGSDYFVLNMREEQLANAQTKNVSAQLDYYKVLANYYAAAVKLDKFLIQ
jgi:outer membrane protein TolC